MGERRPDHTAGLENNVNAFLFSKQRKNNFLPSEQKMEKDKHLLVPNSV